MTNPDQPNRGVALPDPRKTPDYLAQLYPQANGREAPPPDSAPPNDRMTLDFLAAYYRLNREYHKLIELRQRPASPERSYAERAQLRAIERALIARDDLEDLYAPFGVIAAPVTRDGFTTDVKFSFGNVDSTGKVRSDLYTITAYVPVSPPKGARSGGFSVRIEGPGINPE